MADDEHGAGIVREHLLQQVQRLQVEIVGGLVQHQQVGGLRQRPGQRQPAALAAGEDAHRRARLSGVNRKSFM